MAGLRNTNGQIVINEQEAEEDIRKIKQAMSKLSDAMNALNPSNIDSNLMHGETHDALFDVFSKLHQQLLEWENNCNYTIKYINNVVRRYQEIDRAYKARIKTGK